MGEKEEGTRGKWGTEEGGKTGDERQLGKRDRGH